MLGMLDIDATQAFEQAAPVADYETVRSIIAFISEHWRRQPTLEEISEHVNMSSSSVHHLFRRWAGLTPKAFLQALTLSNAKSLLQDSATVLDATYEVGLSGPGRLHDLFVTHEAMTPGDYRGGGAGIAMFYGFHPSPFGEVIIVATARGVAGLGFVDDGNRESALADMRRRWKNASYQRDDGATGIYVQRIFHPDSWNADQPLKIVLIGTDFEVRVWETLLRIPMGKATTYSDIAAHIGKPKASRAVGAAVGKNPISFVVPCHRVIGKSGALTGYHWGLTRKQAMLGWESGQV
jgi:O-6-methylguanine DNA methyltransferase